MSKPKEPAYEGDKSATKTAIDFKHSLNHLSMVGNRGAVACFCEGLFRHG